MSPRYIKAFCALKYTIIVILIKENDSIYQEVVFTDAILYPSLKVFLHNIFLASLASILLKQYFPDSRNELEQIFIISSINEEK